ncbi:MAG: Gfo/Idh/MocA family oxidoreductase [Rhodospirillaceae bacterium]|jgi:predicted dehydrogenase|nr:Gfo/Idh/MocA family oxidoreductase [Rhodospirillaceae bacterium]MBT5243196.1 Gfo/Idh/MocA family oxidoreductase [Rhodospirillaceae bacterium]MBT6243735.1 Gfo/Idh/MocA family oxidoreductase [Rhodospirillaceae bacterium]MBT7942824.1 Gfo/Idh/MocA family oxidoreductase [Alphaproteobacteria bacterium]
MSPLRIALIGAGNIGHRHLKVLLADPDYQVVGIADPAPNTADYCREQEIPYFADPEAMLDEVRPDGAIVAVPNQLHVITGLACLSRKVPVLIEKPLADSLDGALDILDAVESSGVPVLVGHHRRHNPIMRRAAEILREDGVGKIIAVAGMWLAHKPDDYFDIPWRRQPGAGPILTNAIHDIDNLRMLCGEIETIQASTSNTVRGHPIEDTAAAVITFANGALGTLIVSDTVTSPWSWEWVSEENPYYPHEPRDCYLVTGTGGSLAVPSLELCWHEPGGHWGTPLTKRRNPVTPGDAYIEQMCNFADVIRGKAEPVVSAFDGARTLAATLAITLSARSGQPVQIDDLMRRDRDPDAAPTEEKAS